MSEMSIKERQELRKYLLTELYELYFNSENIGYKNINQNLEREDKEKFLAI